MKSTTRRFALALLISGSVLLAGATVSKPAVAHSSDAAVQLDGDDGYSGATKLDDDGYTGSVPLDGDDGIAGSVILCDDGAH